MKVELLESMGNDLSVVNAARVSFNKEKQQFDVEDEKLIKYLARNRHWTPLAQVHVKCRVEMPVFLARQYFKHIVGSVKNEVSRRYVDDDPEFWGPDMWRSRPDKSIKQGSGGSLDHKTQNLCDDLYWESVETSMKTYRILLSQGVAPEQARAVLPQSMMTTVIDSGTLVYWARMYKQRVDTHAQREWDVLTSEIDKVMRQVAPVSWEELIK